jgi:hypothetical protein
MADPRKETPARDPVAKPAQSTVDLAAEAERSRTPWTPVRALTGVWLAVAAVVALLIAAALTLYFVSGGH